MKQRFLLFFVLMFTLSGCYFYNLYNRADVIVEADKTAKERYEYFSTNKTMSKAFEAYEWFNIGFRVPGDYAGSDDSVVRFCDTDYFSRAISSCADDSDYDRGIRILTKIKGYQLLGNLNSKTRLSDEDARCLARKCKYYCSSTFSTSYSSHGVSAVSDDWIHYDDECIVRRRNLLKNEALTEWDAFNYKDYIPEYAKIGTYKKFIDLYHAYNADINECERKREQLETTATEYENCIQSVENKMEQIVKSGVLQ